MGAAADENARLKISEPGSFSACALSRLSARRYAAEVAMRASSVIIVALLAWPSASAQAEESTAGSICVAPFAEAMRRVDQRDSSGNRPTSYTYQFSVQVDEQDPVEIQNEHGTEIAGLDSETKHVIILRDAERRVAAFPFTFATRGTDKLCFHYDPVFHTWLLARARVKPDCGCQKRPHN